eukprot:TRINITY_DN5918_c0_g1_i6.p2 TRINITY_DN5918_c0_g1~~TRINITY_DN5918_c0_g1_i6.p2  ORF type:complete len:100 (-),score=4.81 TRINITY_DN5918_c0_g1_i6:144-443(-)
MAQHNKPTQWAKKKSAEDLAMIMAGARKYSAEAKRNEQERNQLIDKKRKEAAVQNVQLQKERKRKQEAKKEELKNVEVCRTISELDTERDDKKKIRKNS